MNKSVEHLITLYTVVIGIALSYAIESLIDKRDLAQMFESVGPISLFIAFVCLLVPFYHGALMHLNERYLRARNIVPSALILDFCLLFIHAVAFVILSLRLNYPVDFGIVLLVILFIDVVWGIFTNYVGSKQDGARIEGKWALLNVITLLLICPIVYCKINAKFQFDDDGFFALVLMSIVAIRAVVDYTLGWQFYFPKNPR